MPGLHSRSRRSNSIGFSPLRFSTYAKDLSQAVYDLSKQKMSDYGKSSSIPHVRQPKQVYEPPISYTPIARQSFMSETPETGTELPKVDVVPADPQPVDDVPTSNITGLQSGAFKDALVQMRQRIADKQKQAVGKIVGAVAGAEAKMDAAADEVTAKVDKEIAAAIQEFAQHSNGGPV